MIKSSFHGIISEVEVGSKSDTADQFGGAGFYVQCGAGDTLSIVTPSGRTVSYKTIVAGWQSVLVKRLRDTGTTIADSTTFYIGK